MVTQLAIEVNLIESGSGRFGLSTARLRVCRSMLLNLMLMMMIMISIEAKLIDSVWSIGVRNQCVTRRHLHFSGIS